MVSREEEHLDSCWDGCDDLHDDESYCDDPECDCDDDSMPVVDELGFARLGLL